MRLVTLFSQDIKVVRTDVVRPKGFVSLPETYCHLQHVLTALQMRVEFILIKTKYCELTS